MFNYLENRKTYGKVYWAYGVCYIFRSNKYLVSQPRVTRRNACNHVKRPPPRRGLTEIGMHREIEWSSPVLDFLKIRSAILELFRTNGRTDDSQDSERLKFQRVFCVSPARNYIFI
jgi:hypothetical protein